MSDTKALFDTLRAAADPQVVAAIASLVSEGSDRELCRINVLDFAAKHGLDEEKTIGAFLHAARLGLFELSWNVLCPGCGGVLDAMHTLKSVRKDAYDCALCACRLRADARRDGRGHLHGQPARARGSRRTIRIRCRSWNISGRFSGARASICRRRAWRN